MSDVVKFLAQTSDCAHLASFMREEGIDGHAFLLLNYPTIKEYWHLKKIIHYGKKVIPTCISTKTKIAIFLEGFSQVGHL